MRETRIRLPLLRRNRVVTIGVQGAVVDGLGRFLLVRHGYRPGWHFPGGGLEPGETAGLALARELVEEAGVIVEAAPRLHGIFSHFEEFPGDHIALFVVTAWKQPEVPEPNFEIEEQRFVRPDDLPEGTTRGTRRRVAEIANGLTRSRAW